MSFLSKIKNKLFPRDPTGGCGYYGAKLPLTHPLTSACDAHDLDFDEHDQRLDTESYDEVNNKFLKNMLQIAGKNLFLRWQAYALYGIAGSVGWLMW